MKMKSVIGGLIIPEIIRWRHNGMAFVVCRNRERSKIRDSNHPDMVEIKSKKIVLNGGGAGVSAMQQCIYGKVEKT